MSGIGGILQLQGEALNLSQLQQMNAALAQRGADRKGFWHDTGVGLTHRMMWTTPESLVEKLPFQASELTITADARIDNRDDLLLQLDFHGRTPAAITDSELILAAYRKWGKHCPVKLIGDFAFAIWDAQERELFCARDCFGVRPFHYHYAPGKQFAFASEIKALLCLPEIPQVLHEVKIVDYFLEDFSDKASTFYQHILRLPPAHHMTVSCEGIKLVEYWQLDPNKELNLTSDEAYAEAYRELFVEAVRVRIRSAYPVGSTLSGGLDSSSVACVSGSLLQARGETLHTFSVVFDEEKRSDERPFIHEVLSKGEYQPHFIVGDCLSLLGDLDNILDRQDEPFSAPQYFLTQGIWREAEQSGVRVLLEGLMGDNVVGHGFSYLNDLARQWHWIELYNQVNALAKNHDDPAPVNHIMRHFLWKDGIKSHLPAEVIKLWRVAQGKPLSAIAVVPPLFNADFARRNHLLERVKDTLQQAKLRTTRQVHYHDLISGIIPTALEIYDRGAATFRLDERLPFLDRRLVEFSLATPARQKLDAGYTRIIARRALKGYLPEAIRWRSSKGDLGWNFVKALQTETKKNDIGLLGHSKVLEPYINTKYVDQVYQRIAQGSRNEDELLTAFMTIMLGSWLNRKSVNLQSKLQVPEGEF